MTTTPLLLLYAANAAAGGYLLMLWFRGARKPALIGLHVLLGAGALETLFAFVRLSDLPDDAPAHRLAMIAGSLMALAMFSGFVTPLLARQSRTVANSLLAAHVCSGAAGFFLVLAFVAQV